MGANPKSLRIALIPHGRSDEFSWAVQALSRKVGRRKGKQEGSASHELIAVATKLEFVAFGSSATLTLMPDKSRVARKKYLFQHAVSDILSVPEYVRVGLMCDQEDDAAANMISWVRNLELRHAQQNLETVLCGID